jgi:hypothetical protein
MVLAEFCAEPSTYFSKVKVAGGVLITLSDRSSSFCNAFMWLFSFVWLKRTIERTIE